MEDRRSMARSRTLYGGVVAFHPGLPTTDCLVRNLSTAGAKISFADGAILPDKFDLRVGEQQRTFKAQMIWRRAREAGVAFVSDGIEADPARLPVEHVAPAGERRQTERRRGGSLRALIADVFGLRALRADEAALRTRIARISGAA